MREDGGAGDIPRVVIVLGISLKLNPSPLMGAAPGHPWPPRHWNILSGRLQVG